MNVSLSALVVLLAFIGFSVAYYLYHKKGTGERLICPMKAKCDVVINSRHAKFLGLRVEVLGLLYYGFIGLAYIALLIFPVLSVPIVYIALFFATICAFAFSIYLTLLQAVVIKNWCTWCICSALICTGIFFAALFGMPFDIVDLFLLAGPLFLILHLTAVALGVGGATLSDIFFFKFVRDLKISHDEASVFNTLSQAIWFALGLFIISGIGLFVPNADVLIVSAKFLVKLVVVAIIILNGWFLYNHISPRITKICFGDEHEHAPGELKHLRNQFFASGAVSLVSWYTALILGSLRSSPAPFGVLLGIYIVLLLGAVGVSQIMARR